MDLQTLTFLFVGITFTLYIGIAFWARSGSTHEFYVAGGGIPHALCIIENQHYECIY
jgi:cation/acetate symporter